MHECRNARMQKCRTQKCRMQARWRALTAAVLAIATIDVASAGGVSISASGLFGSASTSSGRYGAAELRAASSCGRIRSQDLVMPPPTAILTGSMQMARFTTWKASSAVNWSAIAA